jgi:hypothetical protein
MQRFSTAFGVLVCAIIAGFAAFAQPGAVPGQPISVFDQVVITHTERAEVLPGIAHYKFLATVGPGEYDKVMIHRIVREAQTGKPNPDSEAVMLLPGSPTYFIQLFVQPLISEVPARDRALAIYLAKNGIDVWGMDYGYYLVPMQTTDFEFMKGWGADKDTAHVHKALQFARLTRWTSGTSPGPIFLGGLSYGATLTYWAAAAEAHRPPFLRNVKGIIPMDMAVRLEDEALREAFCDLAAKRQERIDNGIYHSADGIGLRMIGNLAIEAPDEPSPLAPGFTNHQFGMVVGTSGGPPLFWNFVGSERNPQGIATGFRFTEERLWFDILRNGPNYAPVQPGLDGETQFCTPTPTPHHNPLRHIRVPVLYIGGAGGFGRYGEYSVRLTGSRDTRSLIVQTLPDDDRNMDYGHLDLLSARDAETQVWKPMLDWIKARR